MSQSLIELAKELTVALIQTGNLLPKDVQETLQKTHKILTARKAREESESPRPGALVNLFYLAQNERTCHEWQTGQFTVRG